jgi:bis(5'-nucleosyl)-tetraphosphatase (symmetrical)
MSKRTIVIGDVHGCLQELDELLVKVAYDATQDRLVFAGDLVDRGPDSIGVIRRVRELKAECVMGNHDEKHVRYYRHQLKKVADPKYKVPMRHFGTDKLVTQAALTSEDFAFLEGLPPWIKLDDEWVVVHAGFEPNKTLEEQYPDRCTHIRFLNPDTLRAVSLDENYEPPPGSIYWTELYQGPYNVIYGHNVHWLDSPEIRVSPSGVKTVGIDTGCCFGGMLTAFVLPTQEIVMVKAHKAYFARKEKD